MKLDEILRSPLLEMSYRKRKAESIITGLEKPINDHLLKLLLVDGHEDRDHWRKELLNWLTEIAEIRLKPNHKPAASSFYFDILFDEPFGGVEEQNIESRKRRLTRDGYNLRAVETSATVVALRDFHQRFAVGCASGNLDDAGISAIIDQTIPR